MDFGCARFICAPGDYHREFSFRNPAPLFRKTVTLDACTTARLSICGLGFAYCWINGEQVSRDLFTAPLSDYTKTLWYNTYDVAHLLRPGKNTVSVICGNGWYNETVPTHWGFHEAPWRDRPKFILRLETDCGEILSDASWRCRRESATVFNQLRLGEYYDARLEETDWQKPDYDDSHWEAACLDSNPPIGEFRECLCEPIREHEVLSPVAVIQTGENCHLYDFGQNISGYARLTAAGTPGAQLTLRYAECIDEENCLAYYGMDTYDWKTGFQTDQFTCSGKKTTWSPRFTYHGFRYIEVTGCCDDLQLEAVFVHQAVRRRTEFSCSDPYLNKLFACGVISSYSNMFYQLTDCPTREKYGWTNDAQSSCEQMLTNFQAEKLLAKWHRDITDAMRPDGALPGIVPTSGWGYHWGNGPVSDGVLFEIPYRIYLHTGDPALLVGSLPYFRRYLAYLESRTEADGLIHFGLGDWAAPGRKVQVETGFINAILTASFYQTAALAAGLCRDPDESRFLAEANRLRRLIMERYLDKEGRCTVHAQCAVAMLVYYGLYREITPLKNQLRQLLEENNCHLDCGMVGMRRLLHALSKCGLSGDGLKLLKAEGYPGYKSWMDNGATSLWEKWDFHRDSDSKNHHMYSDFMSWLIKTLAGIRLDKSKCGQVEFLLEPEFLDGIDFVDFRYRTARGDISVSWKRNGDTVQLHLKKDTQVKISFRGIPVVQNEATWLLN